MAFADAWHTLGESIIKGGFLLRYTIQYIPLSKIRLEESVKRTPRIKELRLAALDCLHMLIVRKDRKKGGYLLVSGMNHFDYFKKHTKKTAVPCLVDESKVSSNISSILYWLRKKKLPYDIPNLKANGMGGGSWSIIHSFMKKEPRFSRLSRRQQIKVLRLGFQYKKTTVACMKAKVDAFLSH